MPGRLEGRVAVITGGGGGVGRAAAELFVEEGAKVAVVDIDKKFAKDAANGIDPTGEKALAVTADLHHQEEAERAIRETAEYFGELNILANVAGVRVGGPVTEADPESWSFILGGNLLGPAYCSKYAIPYMAAAGGGSIVHVSSSNAIQGRPGMSQYDASKSALFGLSRDMAWDHASDNIRVNCLCPGRVLTPYHVRKRAERDSTSYEEAEAAIRAGGAQGNILKRHSEPREIAYGILFLASDESSYVTGTVLVVDGGVTA